MDQALDLLANKPHRALNVMAIRTKEALVDVFISLLNSEEVSREKG